MNDLIGATRAAETVLTGARLVLPDAVMDGTLAIRDGRIAAIAEGASGLAAAIDCDGDYLIPGIVDLHTDNLERQVQPRINARWPSRSAMLAHDAQCAVFGVTTVFDALCVGDLGFDASRLRTFREGVADLDALAPTGLLRAEHVLHLRCELPAADLMALVEPVADHPRVGMISLMDHSPGVGQYADLERYRAMRRRDGMAEDAIEARIETLAANRATWRDRNRRALLARVAARGVPLASHDDRTEEEIAENVGDGIAISEFPVSAVAAAAARAGGMQVIAGAPNIVRGGSHSGNVDAATLVAAGHVDALASDYVPSALIEAVFRIAGRTPLPQAIALVTAGPARLAGLHDRGRIAEGLRADLVRVRVHDGLPVVRGVWRGGVRVG